MAGIYIHVPFCKTRCLYCDFFSNTRMDKKSAYLDALCEEIANRKDYLQQDPIKTLYFGGGTPSQLSRNDLESIFHTIRQYFDLSQCEEITLEANPEDLSPEYIQMLRTLPFNRISMGVQSFSDKDLKFLNRRHNARRALDAVRDCQRAGFQNISIDLMYGLPGQTLDDWKLNLETALSLNIQHISSYHLIYEEGTALYRLLQGGKINPVDEDLSVSMFRTLIETLKEGGFLHYEISNFALEGYYSKHNTSYWTGDRYLGLGPGAHSFDGECRHFNIGDMEGYIHGKPVEEEKLSHEEHYNEFILTSLRTMWGLPLKGVQEKFGEKLYQYCLTAAAPHLQSGMLVQTEGRLKLSPEGIFVSDGIMSDLMYV